MKIKVSKQFKNKKERIIFELSPDKSNPVEQKVMRSIASANFGEKVFIRHKPIIELAFNTKQKYKVVQSMYPPLSSKPEIVGALNVPLLDDAEYQSALRTIQAQCLLSSLGVKIPTAIAKKFNCRCGLDFISPREFIDHRRVCPRLLKQDAELLARGKIILDREIALEASKLPAAKIKETFPCRCGHPFPSARTLKQHQKLCSKLVEDTELFERGKSFLSRVKDESKVSKSKKGRKERNKKSVGKQVSDTVVKPKRRRKKAS